MDKGDVSRTLCGLGLLPSSVCYFYMAEALLLVTKHVYPDVARCFDTNWKCVERGLRRATNVAWNTAPEKLSELAHRHLTEKPSVSELLSLLTIYLRAEEEN